MEKRGEKKIILICILNLNKLNRIVPNQLLAFCWVFNENVDKKNYMRLKEIYIVSYI